ncbi:hypothetical protein RRG08_024310 [Elysia crispata]|uniref:Uncharacterized protein n=1 Tax=Elysia crispata TaxID=231223 RepID=A0AAE1A3K9_9GAST|nr:hypothetical protein RRG08_024310 [Elysia crispata]
MWIRSASPLPPRDTRPRCGSDQLPPSLPEIQDLDVDQISFHTEYILLLQASIRPGIKNRFLPFCQQAHKTIALTEAQELVRADHGWDEQAGRKPTSLKFRVKFQGEVWAGLDGKLSVGAFHFPFMTSMTGETGRNM